MDLSRRAAKVYADFNGYFWLPCPYPGCGRMFGGHEAGKYVMQYPDEPSSGKMCCKLHDEVTPEKVFLRTGEWGEQLTLAENYHPEPVFTVPVGTEVRTRSGVFPSVPYVKQQDGSWKPKYGTE